MWDAMVVGVGERAGLGETVERGGGGVRGGGFLEVGVGRWGNSRWGEYACCSLRSGGCVYAGLCGFFPVRVLCILGRSVVSAVQYVLFAPL